MLFRSLRKERVCLICRMLVLLVVCDLGVAEAYLGDVVSKEMS